MEDPLLLLRSETDAGVRDLQRGPFSFTVQAQRDSTAGRSVLEAVIHKVKEESSEVGAIPVNGEGCH